MSHIGEKSQQFLLFSGIFVFKMDTPDFPDFTGFFRRYGRIFGSNTSADYMYEHRNRPDRLMLTTWVSYGRKMMSLSQKI